MIYPFREKVLSKLKSLFNRQDLIIFVGDNGINAIESKDGKLFSEKVFIHSNIDHNEEFRNLLKKYSNNKVKIILNFKETLLIHDSLTVLSGLSKSNPVIKYCENQFNSSDYYCYKVYSVNHSQAEMWNIVVASVPENYFIQNLVKLVFEYDIYIEGFYLYQFLTSEIGINIGLKHKLNLNEFVYSVVSINASSGINISIHHAGDIMHNIICEYPPDKSLEYIEGVIEQQLSESWLRFKTYVKDNNLKIANIFVLPDGLHELISKQNYEVNASISVSYSEITDFKPPLIGSDAVITKLVKNYNVASSKGKRLSNYYFYNFLKEIIFKPIYLLITIFLLCSLYYKINYYKVYNETQNTYNSYYKVSESLRGISLKYPEVDNVIVLADLYNLQKLLDGRIPLPFNLVNELINNLPSTELNIKQVNWDLVTSKLGSNYNFNLSIVIEVNEGDEGNAFNQINAVIANVKSKYPTYDIAYLRDHNKNYNIGSKAITIKLIASGV